MSTEQLFDRAAAELTSALEREVLCEIVHEQIEGKLPIEKPGDFWNAVVVALRNRGFQRITGQVQYILNDSRKKGWAVPDARKYIDKAKRKAARQSEGRSKAATYAAPPQEGHRYMAQQALEMTETQSGSIAEEEEKEDGGDSAAASMTMVMR